MQVYLKLKWIVFILPALLCIQCFGQGAKIDADIKNIDDSQFKINHSKKATFSMESKAAFKLIKIGKPATEKLIVALSDSTKTIMAHLILCHIWFKHVSFAGPKIIVTDHGDVSKFYLGEEKGEGLLISEIKNPDGTYKKYITSKDLDTIKAYWNKHNAKGI